MPNTTLNAIETTTLNNVLGGCGGGGCGHRRRCGGRQTIINNFAAPAPAAPAPIAAAPAPAAGVETSVNVSYQ